MTLFFKKLEPRYKVGLFLGAILLFGADIRGNAEITFLDVGQGDCICVQTPTGGCFLFDGGSSSRNNVGEKVILPFLQYEGIDQIDGVFLSHGDIDHYSGILQLLQQREIRINKIVLPRVGKEAMRDFDVFGEHMDKVEYVSKGSRLQWDSLTLTCLHPQEGYEAESNAYSACYFLEAEDFTMLFTGDVEGQGEDLLIQELRKRHIGQVDVLKVAHHGSKYSTTEAFLDVITPSLSLISCGKNNPYGHPHSETLKRLQKVGSIIKSTTENGAIIIERKENGEIFLQSFYLHI